MKKRVIRSFAARDVNLVLMNIRRGPRESSMDETWKPGTNHTEE